ncbi:MAG: alcohol dehydrogenase catalytic domain-containing protein [Actinomycetota bacterium]|nr:alcohol dehydrogenase catalytic domain-containing protein [Actinomycetota bacterium]
MRALALVEPGRVEVVDRPAPTAAPSEVLVRMTGVGICGSDLSVFDGHREIPETPWVLGHEGVGEIVAVGSEVSGARVGERVVIEPNYCCFTCASCRAGLTSGCENRKIVGINVPGLLAEQVAVPAPFAWPAPEGLATEELVCLEPFTVGVAAARRAGARSGQRALVVGTGSTGLLLVLHLVALGLETWFVEPAADRAAIALELGGRPLGEDGERRFEQVFETSGTVPGTELAVASAAPGGAVTLLGLATDPAKIVPSAIVRGRLTIRGSMIYDHPGDFASTTTHPPDGLGRIVRGRFTLDEGQEAFRSARVVAGKSWISLDEEEGASA